MSTPHALPAAPAAESAAYLLAKRLLDFATALLLLVAVAPAAVLLLPWCAAAARVRIRTGEFAGRGGRPMRLHALELAPSLAGMFGRVLALVEHLPRLLALLDGRLSLVGPAPVPPEAAGAFGGLNHPRFSVAPGIVCLWWLRRRGNIDYGSEAEADLEYLAQRSLRADFAILARALVALAYGPRASRWEAVHFISGIRLLNLSMDNLLDAIASALHRRCATRIAFVNPDCVNIAARDGLYRQTLDGFDWVCADGIGMKIAGSLLGRPVRQNLNGTDLFPRLCAALAASGRSLYLLGARPGVAESVAQWAVAHHPRLRIAGTSSGYFSPHEEPALLQQIRAAGADVLLVALGAPRQELWLARNLEASGATVGMGVGGLFDFYSGRIPRAPLWLREIGGEWIYRLLQEPGRMWRRYLVGNWVFLFRIVVEKLSGTRLKGPVK